MVWFLCADPAFICPGCKVRQRAGTAAHRPQSVQYLAISRSWITYTYFCMAGQRCRLEVESLLSASVYCSGIKVDCTYSLGRTSWHMGLVQYLSPQHRSMTAISGTTTTMLAPSPIGSGWHWLGASRASKQSPCSMSWVGPSTGNRHAHHAQADVSRSVTLVSHHNRHLLYFCNID